MIHRLRVLLLISLISFNVLGSQAPLSEVTILKTIREPTKDDLKSSKYLEDYYWAFRKLRLSTLKRSISVLKKSRKSPLYSFVPTLSKGLSIAKKLKSKKLNDCNIRIKGNEIQKQYLRLFKRVCLKNEAKKFVSSKGKLTSTERAFIEKNWQFLSRYRYRKAFINRLQELRPSSRIFFSQQLRNYIFKNQKLPHKDLLQFLVIDQKLTKFIQTHHMFDRKQSSFYTMEFTSIVKAFKREYLLGNDERSEEYLEQAIDFYEQNKSKISDSKAWQLFITSGKRIARQENLNMALDLFKMSEKTADEEQIHESRFQRLFAFFSERKLSEARDFISEEKLIKRFPQINSKLRYWVARVYQETKEYKKAKELFLEQISLSPLSFYSILSLKSLRQFTPDYSYSALIKESNPSFEDLKLSHSVQEKLSLYKIFKLSGNDFLSNIQAREIRKSPASYFFSKNAQMDTERLKGYFLINFFSSFNDHLASFKIAYTGLNNGTLSLNRFVIRNLFPNKYRPILKRKSRFLDERILLSLIRQESAFNEKAKSVVGARGLMQIMPATGRQFVKNLKAHYLYKPELNITIGAKYLENLLKRYEGNLVFALSAYNAGMGNVSKWQRSIPFSQDAISNIELIPFKETRNYVKLIYRNLFFYSYLDGQTSNLDTPINDSFKIALKD